MSTIVKPYTFSAGAVIVAAEHNSDFDTLYTEINGALNNANISATAAIAYSKLNLSASILDADVSSSANIAVSKLDYDSIIFWENTLVSWENELVYIS